MNQTDRLLVGLTKSTSKRLKTDETKLIYDHRCCFKATGTLPENTITYNLITNVWQHTCSGSSNHECTSKQTLVISISLLVPMIAYGETVRVATYNVHYDNFDSDQMIDAIRTSDADIVCLQEACERTIEIIRSRMSDRYPHISIVGQFGFAAKQDPTNVVLDSAKRFRMATFEVNRRPIRIVNTHLTPVALPDQPTFAQVMMGLSKSDQAHQSEVSRILDRTDLNSPTIILGDFNALSGAKAIGKLQSAGLIDSIASKHTDADRHTTWDWQTMRRLEKKKFRSENLGVINAGGGLNIGLRIDYVFHTNHFSTVESKVIRRQGSDHFLIVSELDLSKN